MPRQAVSFGSPDGPSIAVDTANPLPITAMMVAAASTPLSGTAAVSGIVGPFTPQLGRPIWLTLSGTWVGTVQVVRSVDGGATKLPLTVGGAVWANYIANAQEAVAEESVATATYYLQITLTSGNVAYQVAQ